MLVPGVHDLSKAGHHQLGTVLTFIPFAVVGHNGSKRQEGLILYVCGST